MSSSPPWTASPWATSTGAPSTRVSHNLCPEFERFATDYSQILSSLQQFLSMGQSTMPPIYVMSDHMGAAKCITQSSWTRLATARPLTC